MGLVYNLQSQTHVRQALRNAPTLGEEMLWQRLKGSQLGMKFRRQYGVANSVVDFYCPAARLAIEIDGSSHHSDSAQRHDAIRQKEIESLGIVFLRFSESDAVTRTDRVVDQIRAFASSLLT